jgi:hypothetical protein
MTSIRLLRVLKVEVQVLAWVVVQAAEATAQVLEGVVRVSKAAAWVMEA